MPDFVRPNSGLNGSRIRSEVSKVARKYRNLQSIWGFGSFFLRGRFSDIDILVVFSGKLTELTEALEIKRKLQSLMPEWRVPVYVLVLTPREFSTKPLRNMDTLKLLYRRSGRRGPFFPRSRTP